jgi:Glycosyltransferase Family 4
VQRVLMIAFHFPPLAGSSGIQRTLRFVQHLPAMGWQPMVLSANSRAYEFTSSDLLADVPVGTVVHRSFALDTARHLQFGGRYFASMARPDRWVSWRFAATRDGLELIRSFQPDVIWSTYPIATAHLIASELHRKTGIPWVADFRDPMAQEDYPIDPKTWQSYSEIEADAIKAASYCVFTTPSAARSYQLRYPQAASRVMVIENGYDEESFVSLDSLAAPRTQGIAPGRPMLMLHSGIVYPNERDPSQLFEALGRLHGAGILSPEDLRIRFRASVHEELLMNLAMTHGAQDFVEVCAAVSYREALAEMLSMDALLIMQGSSCNAQIPAKLYEYLRAGRPMLGLTDPDGDTAGVMRAAGLNDIARLDCADEISALLPQFVNACRAGHSALADSRSVQFSSRRGRSQSLAVLLGRAAQARALSPSV